jgi:hypothetical protein
MRDELFDRDYQNGRVPFHAAIDHALGLFARQLWLGFARLNRLQWRAPWQREQAPGPSRRRSGLA